MADTHLSVCSKSTPKSVGSELCTQCGLCCTGALHDTATADPDEVEMLRRRGMQVSEGEQLRFLLPCPQLNGTRCGIYESRPRVCPRYRCRILRDVESGTLKFPDALEKIREGRRLYEDALRILPAGMNLPQARALWTGPQHKGDGPSAAHYPAVVLKVLVLMRYIDHHFRHSDEGPLLSEKVMTMDDSEASSRKDS